VAAMQTGSHHFCNASTDRNQRDPHTVVTPACDESDAWVWDLRTAQRVAAIAPRPLPTGPGTAAADGRGMLSSLVFQTVSSSGDGHEQAAAAAAAAAAEGAAATIVAGYEDGSISVYDARTYRPLCDIKLGSTPVMALDMSPDGRRVVAAGAGDSIARCALTLGTSSFSSALDEAAASSTETVFHACLPPLKAAALEPLGAHTLPAEGTACLRYRCDGRVVAGAHWDGSVRLFDAHLRPLAVLRHHRASAYAVDFAPDGRLLATASKDGTIAIWNIFADTVKKGVT